MIGTCWTCLGEEVTVVIGPQAASRSARTLTGVDMVPANSCDSAEQSVVRNNCPVVVRNPAVASETLNQKTGTSTTLPTSLRTLISVWSKNCFYLLLNDFTWNPLIDFEVNGVHNIYA